MHERGNGIQIKRLIDFKRSLRYDWFTLYPSICMSVHKGNSCMSGICVDFRSLHIHRYVIATKYLWNNSLAKCIHLNECLMSFRWVVNLLLGSRLRSSTLPVCTYFPPETLNTEMSPIEKQPVLWKCQCNIKIWSIFNVEKWPCPLFNDPPTR